MRVRGADGVGIHVLADDADGHTPFLLVHGLASNARLWDGVRGALARHGRPAAAVDLRGHGLSDKPDDGYDFATVVADLVAVLDHLGWDEAVIAGQSWGGNVVLELAARHPERVVSVVAVDGGWIRLSDIGPWEVVSERLAPPNTTGTPLVEVEAYMRRVHPGWTDEAIAGALACFEVREDGTVAPWLSRDHHLEILRRMYDHDPTRLFPQIRTPVVLVPCENASPRAERKNDAVAEAERLLPTSRTVWFNASHDVHAERPDDVASILIEEADRR
jgi:pimeloyl-ACP methyl ester carboxylesterase